MSNVEDLADKISLNHWTFSRYGRRTSAHISARRDACSPQHAKTWNWRRRYLFNLVAGLPRARRYVFDMGSVTFIEPCGVIALLSAIRHGAAQAGDRVLIKNLNEQIYPYLHRMDFFLVTEAWLKPLAPLNLEWNRNAQTVNLLELTPVTVTTR